MNRDRFLAGDAIAALMLERSGWSPTIRSGRHVMQWGSARYNDVGFEGWGRLPLVDAAAAADTGQLMQLAAEHSLFLGGSSGAAAEQRQLLAALTPRFVVTLHGKETRPFAMPFISKNDHLTKTGSGRT